ncbi:MAG: RagB/SusD family nutrient uptake outer membrane protein, partial [Bacteroidales bacterium]|nr:RagB/SusD family nutrient uptake outer membrane protein [Bacteroidales bacterium]
DVIENGGYQLEPNVEDLWMPACTQPNGDDYEWITTYAGKHYNANGWQAGQNGISKEFILNINCNTTQDYNGRSGGNVVQVFLGARNSACPPFATGWGICVPNPKFVEQFSNPRMQHSVVDYRGIGFEAQSDFKNCLSDTYEYTGYGIKKYAPLCFADGTREANAFELGEKHMNITYYVNMTIIRYADVLLMHSELTQSADGLNKVQKRAGKSATPYSEEALRTERAQELAFEGIRYWDLLRYGQGGSYAAEQIAKMQNGVSVKNGGVEATTSFDAANLTAKKGIFQIPNTEITLSGNVLDQNAGW